MKHQQENGEAHSPEEASERSGQSFGTWLRQQRVVREIELREIAETSKISMRYLRALEEDRFDVLPATVFAKGFLRQYAKYVGLDPEEVVNFFITALEDTELEEQPVHPRRKTKSVSPWTYLAIFLLLAGILLGVVWLVGYMQRDGEATPVTSAPAALPPDQRAAAVTTPPAAPPPAASLAVEGDEAPVAGAEEPTPSDVSSPVLPSTPAVQPPLAANPAPTAAATTARERDAWPLTVTLDFSGECWVEALSDGRSRLAEMRVQGESLQLVAEREIQLKLGNVDAVEVEVNGRPYQLERVAGTSVRTVTFDLETTRALEPGGARP